MKYFDFFKHLRENNSSDGKEGDDWVRPGSDLEPGMEIGATNFPKGDGYPNYKPKSNDQDDFNEVCSLEQIVDIPHEHRSSDTKKRWIALKLYIKKKYNNFYEKYKDFIDNLFIQYDELPGHWGFESLSFVKEHPNHTNVPPLLKGIEVTDEDLEIVKKIEHFYYVDLYSLIHHRDDAKNPLNYPLNVTLYDITRAFGGYEEGGWWYDKYNLINSVVVRTPEEVIPAAEKLYANIHHQRDGKPYIVIEKHKGSQLQEAPTYS